jgi:cobyric acid synthase
VPDAAGHVVGHRQERAPILLEPEADDLSQLVVRGRTVGQVRFREYRAWQPGLAPVIAESLARLRAAHDVVVIEGAGSPAEINLRDADLANMHVARLTGAPVLLAGDIDRGGVFAALVGTLALLTPADRARVAGLIVNRLRGDPDVLLPGLDELRALTGVLVLGVCASDPFAGAAALACEAYEIHAGVARPFAALARGGAGVDELDGAVDATGTVTGTYLHGVLGSGAVRRALLGWLAARAGRAPLPEWGESGSRGARWDRLADIVARAVHVKAVGELAGRSL